MRAGWEKIFLIFTTLLRKLKLNPASSVHLQTSAISLPTLGFEVSLLSLKGVGFKGN